jgi:hypothetical protein
MRLEVRTLVFAERENDMTGICWEWEIIGVGNNRIYTVTNNIMTFGGG